MATFEFYLSNEEMERLFYVKNDMEHKYDLTGNDFAKEILLNYLHTKCPHVPQMDDIDNDID